MKRYIGAAAGLVLLVLAGWGVFWWVGRGEIARGVDQAVARMEAEGWTIAWEERAIGGFPFGYRMRLTGVTAHAPEDGPAVRLPWLVAETGDGRVFVRMPERFAADLAAGPVPEDGAAAPVATLTGEADGAVAAFLPNGGVEIAAERLTWRLSEPGSATAVDHEVGDLAAVLAPDEAGMRFRIEAARAALESGPSEASGVAPLRAEAAGLVLAGTTTLGSGAGLSEMLYAGAPGQAEARLTAGTVTLHGTDAGGAPGTLDWRSEGVELGAVLESGRMELRAEAEGTELAVAPADEAAPFRGTITIGEAEALYAMPMAPTERPDEMAIRLALRGVGADEASWARIDPEGTLPRDPAGLEIDLTGRARVTERIDRLRPGAPPPYEVPELTVNTLSVEALGAGLEATGTLEFPRPLGRPLGDVRVILTGIGGLIEALGRAGLLPPEMLTTARAIMAVYLSPVEGKDAWTAEIRFTGQGPMVNGLPVR